MGPLESAVKKILMLLLISLSMSCTIEPLCNCSCTEKTYEVTEYQGEIIEQQQTGYVQFNGNCNDNNGGYYVTNITWNGPYKHYTLIETYCY